MSFKHFRWRSNRHLFTSRLERWHCRAWHGPYSIGGVSGLGYNVLDGGIRLFVSHQKSNETRRHAGHGEIGKIDDTHRGLQCLVHGARRRSDIVFGLRVRQSQLLDSQLARRYLSRSKICVTVPCLLRRTGQETYLRGVYG